LTLHQSRKPTLLRSAQRAEDESAEWQALWRDVDDLAKQLAKKDEPTKGRK
jgi:hypothetical protein